MVIRRLRLKTSTRCHSFTYHSCSRCRGVVASDCRSLSMQAKSPGSSLAYRMRPARRHSRSLRLSQSGATPLERSSNDFIRRCSWSGHHSLQWTCAVSGFRSSCSSMDGLPRPPRCDDPARPGVTCDPLLPGHIELDIAGARRRENPRNVYELVLSPASLRFDCDRRKQLPASLELPSKKSEIRGQPYTAGPQLPAGPP